ncbi:MAG TPA: hypothetical protein ENJ95_05255 [Bacteroidetes bacterium]|nr:hypothetical protein [Bacteroidota bacterium]
MHDYFEQKIKKVLNDPPDFPVDEKAWENLQNRMQGKPAKGWGKMAYLAPLALLLWLVPVAFLWHTNGQLNEANNKIAHLETLLRSNAALLLDTVVQRHVTIVYDTVYKAVYADVNIGENKNNEPQQSFNQSFSPYLYKNENPYFTALNRAPINSLFAKPGYLPEPLLGFGNNIDNIKPENIAAEKNTRPSPPLYVQQLPLKSFANNKNRNLSIAAPPYILKKNKKGLRYYMYKMQPTHFSLGAGYGMVDILKFGAGKRDIFARWDATIGYGKNINLLTGLEFLKWEFVEEYQKEADETLIFKDYPEELPNSPTDELDEIYIDFRYIQIPVGMEYVFSNQNRWRPFIGSGLMAQRAFRSRLTYEYERLDNSDYKKQKDNILPNSFVLKSAWSSFGIQYAPGDHWSFRLEGSAQFDLEKGKYKYEGLQFYKLKSGLKYRF